MVGYLDNEAEAEHGGATVRVARHSPLRPRNFPERRFGSASRSRHREETLLGLVRILPHLSTLTQRVHIPVTALRKYCCCACDKQRRAICGKFRAGHGRP